MKSIWGAAALMTGVLVIGSVGGATAAGLVTSKQIKDNTIQSRDVKNGSLDQVDLNATTRALLAKAGAAGPRGATGATGPAGAAGAAGQDGSDGRDGRDGLQGPQGAQGQPGADGVSQYSVVTSYTVTLGTSYTDMIGTARATCTGGTKPLGGGYDVQGAVGSVHVMSAKIVGSAYEVTAINTGTSSGSVTAQATCALVR